MFYTDPLNAKTNKYREGDASELDRIDYPKKEHKFATDDELAKLPAYSAVINDCEVYPNYFLAAFKHVDTGLVFYEEISAERQLNVGRLQWIMWHFKIITFNGFRYDLPIIDKAMREPNTLAIQELSNKIIVENEYITSKFNYNHIDLIEPAPMPATGLKTYAGRMHAPRMQDLPIKPNIHLTREEGNAVREYCFNDLDNTELLFKEILPDIVLREQLGQDYKQDLRSKSDAQLAETVIVSEIERLTRKLPTKVETTPNGFYYTIPKNVSFQTKLLQDTLQLVKKAFFELDATGAPIMPTQLANLRINIGQCTYRMGMGGLHSSEQSVSHYADENTLLIDRDVASYYPMIIINQKLYPKHIGPAFLDIFGLGPGLVGRRLLAKKNKNKVAADGMKIVVNGTFGKLGNRYSFLYSPDLCMQVTISGQLYLLMLIEAIEMAGIPVISANTDGIVIKCPVDRYDELQGIIFDWEAWTTFETEETRYRSTHNRDVNNYIAIKTDGEVKAKGIYAEKGSQRNSRLSKNPETLILSDAIQAYLVSGVSVDDWISRCRSIERFVAVRSVVGGARMGRNYLGKVCRWYYARGVTDALYYCKSGNKVPKTYGAKPLMYMDGTFPDDIDYDWYINEANKMLYDLGALKKPQQSGLFE